VILCRTDAPAIRANLQDLLALEQQAQTEEHSKSVALSFQETTAG